MTSKRRKPVREEILEGYDVRSIRLAEATKEEKRLLEVEEIQKALRDELRLWLNEQFVQFGKWSLKGIVALILAGLVYLFITTHGWKVPS